jgi:HEAT repeat protein
MSAACQPLWATVETLPSFFTLPPLDSSRRVLAVFAATALLAGLLYQVGLLGLLLTGFFRLLHASYRLGFQLWKSLLAALPWPLLVLIILGVHALLWLDDRHHATMTLLAGVLLLFIGVTSCLAYLYIGQERADVARGYKVLSNPDKGQELADSLVVYGPRAGVALLVAACVAVISGFALLNTALYKTPFGHNWYVVGAHDSHLRLRHQDQVPDTDKAEAEYPDFLACALIHLVSAVDLVDLLNTYHLSHISYVHPARWPASTLLVLFRAFFITVLLQQLFTAIRHLRLIQDSVRDLWSPHEPIQRRAGENLTQQGVLAVRYLLRSMETIAALTPEQRQLLPRVLAGIGPASVGLLVRRLKHLNPHIREVVMAALGQLQAIGALPQLIRAAQDDSEGVRLQLTGTLAELCQAGGSGLRKRWQMQRPRRRRWWAWRRPHKEVRDPVCMVVEALRPLLADPSRAVRCGAVVALSNLGPDAAAVTADLASLATDEDESVRLQTAQALGQVAGPTEVAVPALLRLLEDVRPAVRAAAARALGQRPEEASAAIPLLVALVQDRTAEVRQAAAEAIGAIGTLDGRPAQRLLAGLKDPDNLVRVQAAAALGIIGPSLPWEQFGPALVEALGDGNDPVRSRAAWALGQLGPAAAPALPALVRALNDEDYRVSALAAEALGGMGHEAAPAVGPLLEALENINAEVRCQVAAALAGIRPSARQAAEPLTRRSRDEDAAVRHQALLALAALPDLPPERADVFLAGLKDVDPQVRMATVQGLAQAGFPATLRLPALLEVLSDPSDEVLAAVAAALGMLEAPPEEAIAGLVQLLQHDGELVSTAAARSLGKLGVQAIAALEALQQRLPGGSAELRQQILRALIPIQPQQALPAFLTGLHDTDVEVRRLASAGLMMVADVSSDLLPAIAEGLKDPDAQVRCNVAAVLAQQPALPAAAFPLLLVCTADPDDGLRLSALRALAQAPLDSLAPVLPRLLEDTNPNIRQLAAGYALRLSPTDETAGTVLREALGSDLPRVRRQALELLESLGSRAAPFAADLQRLQAAEDPEARSLVQRVLDNLAPPAEEAEPVTTTPTSP